MVYVSILIFPGETQLAGTLYKQLSHCTLIYEIFFSLTLLQTQIGVHYLPVYFTSFFLYHQFKKLMT